jgi:hypothetical protein
MHQQQHMSRARCMNHSIGGQPGGFPVEQRCSVVARCDSALILRRFCGSLSVHQKGLAYFLPNYYA